MEFLDIVDDDDEVIGSASISDIYEKHFTHRIVHIFVFNGERMLLQLRSNEARFCPLHWCTAAAGHVKSGESYEEAAARELQEETFIQAKPVFLFKDVYEYDPAARKMLASFRAEYDGQLTPGDKVEKLEFFSLEKIGEMIKGGEKFHPELLFLLRKHYGIR